MAIDTGFVRDVRYALRSLGRTPAFTALAILILTLGIGANTAIFSLVNAVLLKPLPFVEPDRLVLLWEDVSANGGPSRVEPAPANFVDWKARSNSFEGVAAFANLSYNLTGAGEPEKLNAVRTTPNLFEILGLQALAGRTFLPDETVETTPAVVIGQSLWIRRFGADPTVVGRNILLNGTKYTVIGVVPPEFKTPSDIFPGEIDVWVPTTFSGEELSRRSTHYMYVVARLKRGLTLQQAQADMNTVTTALAQEYAENRGMAAAVVPLQEHIASDSRPTLLLLLGSVSILLLITCANVANLVLARGARRAQEIALRKAIGAASSRILRQLLTESTVLVTVGGALGIALAATSFGYLTHLIPVTFPSNTVPTLDWRVLVFTTGVALVTVLLFGAGPALRAARVNLSDTLRVGPGRGFAGRHGRFGGALVVAEIMLTVVLLSAAGLLLRSYANVISADPGYRSHNLLILETPLPSAKYTDRVNRSAFYSRVLDRVRELPGVTNAGYANFAPLLFKGGRVSVTTEGGPPLTPQNVAEHLASDRFVTAGYLETLGVPLIGGRFFDSRDTAETQPTAIINQSMAQKFWSGDDPVGRRFKIAGPDGPWITVAGIVGNIRQMGMDRAPEPEMYLSANQTALEGGFFWPQHLLVRTSVDPLTLTTALRSAVSEIDPDQPVSNIRTMSQVFDSELESRDTQLTLVGVFAVLALSIAAVGLYGVLSYSVAQRTSEIGLRMALGAKRHEVIGAVVGGALKLTAVGLALGLLGALALTRVVSSLLFEVSPTDPATLTAATFLLLAVATLSAYLPARRAAGIDPSSALRGD
jgi:predicted permease